MKDIYQLLLDHNFKYNSCVFITKGKFAQETISIYYKNGKSSELLTATLHISDFKKVAVEVFPGILTYEQVRDQFEKDYFLKPDGLFLCVIEPFESAALKEIREGQLELFDIFMRAFEWTAQT